MKKLLLLTAFVSSGFMFAQQKTSFVNTERDAATTNSITTVNNLQQLTPDQASLVILENPVKDVLKISLSNKYKVKAIRITNLSGQRIKLIQNNEPFINMGALTSGSYILSIETDSGVVSSKFMKS